MSDAFYGQIQMFGFNFAPRNWAYCSGALIAISQNNALFSLLGTLYGGDGRTTFALPNLNARAPVGAQLSGSSPGLTPHQIGTFGGYQNITLTDSHLPTHSHSSFAPGSANPVSVNVSTDVGTSATPSANAYLADVVAGGGATDRPELIYRPDAGAGTVPLGGVTVEQTAITGNAGLNQSFPVQNPYLALNFCICTVGIYPSRS